MAARKGAEPRAILAHDRDGKKEQASTAPEWIHPRDFAFDDALRDVSSPRGR